MFFAADKRKEVGNFAWMGKGTRKAGQPGRLFRLLTARAFKRPACLACCAHMPVAPCRTLPTLSAGTPFLRVSSGPRRHLAPALQLKESQPDLKLGEIGKATGEAWKNLSDKEKAPYQKKAEEAKVGTVREAAVGGAADGRCCCKRSRALVS